MISLKSDKVVQPFNLQLFSEPPAEPVVIETPQGPQDTATSDNDSGYDFALVDGELIIKDSFFDDWLNEKPDDEVDTGEPTEPSEEPPVYYSAEEVRTTDFEKLDPTKISPEMQPYYKSMQAGFTTKAQALAEERRKFEQERAQFEALRQQMLPPAQQPAQPQPEPFDPKMYYNTLADVAKQSVERAFNEPFNELNPVHLAALADEVGNVKVQIYERQQHERALANTVRQYTSDPDWAEIDKFAAEKILNLPYREYVEAQNRIKAGDAYYVNLFLGKAVEEFKAQKYGQSTPTAPQVQQPTLAQPVPVGLPRPKPPYVEPAGSGTQKETQPRFDMSQLHNASQKEKAQMISKLLNL